MVSSAGRGRQGRSVTTAAVILAITSPAEAVAPAWNAPLDARTKVLLSKNAAVSAGLGPSKHPFDSTIYVSPETPLNRIHAPIVPSRKRIHAAMIRWSRAVEQPERAISEQSMHPLLLTAIEPYAPIYNGDVPTHVSIDPVAMRRGGGAAQHVVHGVGRATGDAKTECAQQNKVCAMPL